MDFVVWCVGGCMMDWCGDQVTEATCLTDLHNILTVLGNLYTQTGVLLYLMKVYRRLLYVFDVGAPASAGRGGRPAVRNTKTSGERD